MRAYLAFPAVVLAVALGAGCSGGNPMPDMVVGGDAVDVPAPDVVDPCALDRAYSFGFEGGQSSFLDDSVLAPPRSYTHRRTNNSTMMTMMCTAELPTCGGAGITAQDIARAFANPDVVGAFRATVAIVYGVDDRLTDGQVLALRRADMHEFFVGSPCPMGDPTCRPVPAGIATLAGILYALDQQELARPECMALH